MVCYDGEYVLVKRALYFYSELPDLYIQNLEITAFIQVMGIYSIAQIYNYDWANYKADCISGKFNVLKYSRKLASGYCHVNTDGIGYKGYISSES